MKALIRTVSFAALSAVAFSASRPPEIPVNLPEFPLPKLTIAVNPISPKLLQVAPPEISSDRLEILMSCGGVFEFEEPSPLGLIDLFGSIDALRHVLAADSVVIAELKPTADYFSPATEHSDRKITLPPADAEALRAVLCSDSSYDWASTPKPESGANYRVKFERDGRVLSLDLFLTTRGVRLTASAAGGAPGSLKFGYPIATEIIERHFPGAFPSD